MKRAGVLNITARGDREIVMSRDFNAPRELVFDCWTKPELVRRWLGALPGWTMPVCEIDFRIGGSYRYVWRHENGEVLGMGGVYREIVVPKRFVCTEVFDKSWYPGEALDTTELVERAAAVTTVTTTVLYQSNKAREVALNSGMAKGVAAGYDRLEEILAELISSSS